MDCQYCVAKDFVGIEEEDLVVSTDMVRWVNRSPFMLLVLTGGEPLMPPYDAVSMRLINSIHGRGVIVDTNGTFMPSRSVLARLKSRNVMVRVSLDSMNPKDEIPVRRVSKEQKYDSRFAYDLKMANIENFVAAGVKTAVQTVVWQSNKEHLYQIIDWLEEKGIKRWYLQRLIPSYKFKDRRIGRVLKPEDYYPLANWTCVTTASTY
jgi:MoaA/NifB/PqqE/SkfB family radical SAM enzyme